MDFFNFLLLFDYIGIWIFLIGPIIAVSGFFGIWVILRNTRNGHFNFILDLSDLASIVFIFNFFKVA